MALGKDTRGRRLNKNDRAEMEGCQSVYTLQTVSIGRGKEQEEGAEFNDNSSSSLGMVLDHFAEQDSI